MEAHHDSFDWRSFFSDHPLFGDLGQDEIDSLLDPGNSKQQSFKRGEVVFRAGEISNSFFLIGEGSVDVELASEESSATTICTLYRGDYFGELAAIDSQDGRAATILAHEDCILLEIKSKPFQEVIKANPELEFKLLTMLASRLRHVNDHLLKNTRLTYDTKFSLLSEKIESQSKVVDASLDASQAVFEQTKVRTSEVIEAAERGRARLTWMLSILTTGFTLVFGVLGFFGYTEFKAAESNAKKIDEILIEIQKKEVVIDAAANQAELSAKSIEDAKENVAELKDTVAVVKTTLGEQEKTLDLSKQAQQILFETLIPIFSYQVDEKIRTGNDSEPGTIGLQMLALNDAEVTIKLLKRVFSMISESHQKILIGEDPEFHRARVSFCTSFMYLYFYSDDERTNENQLAKFLSSYLLLISYAIDDAYAKDNDFYHNIIDPKQYPLDGFNRRLQALLHGEVFGPDKIKLLTVKYDLAGKFDSELNQINDPDSGFNIAADQKKSINQILGYTFRPKS